MKINIWAVGKQFEFTPRQARAVYKELGELFDQEQAQEVVLDLRPSNGTNPAQLLFGRSKGDGGK